ncbi:hypothetical protein ACJX0J_016875, partial [Zea mays]
MHKTWTQLCQTQECMVYWGWVGLYVGLDYIDNALHVYQIIYSSRYYSSCIIMWSQGWWTGMTRLGKSFRGCHCPNIFEFGTFSIYLVLCAQEIAYENLMIPTKSLEDLDVILGGIATPYDVGDS